MKLLNLDEGGQLALGVLSGTGSYRRVPGIEGIDAYLRADAPLRLQYDAALRDCLAGAGPDLPLARAALAPVVRNPGKVICLGLNFLAHAKEGGNPVPDYPTVFLRCASSLVAHGRAIMLPAVSDKLDFEAELAVVIGTRAKNCPMKHALAHVAGYACFNDASLRDYQRKTTQWTMGKNFDQTGALGPCLTTVDALPAGASGLHMQSRLNGRVMQDTKLDDMIFSVAQTISLVSDVMTLEPGDVIVMGTPAGVGYARKPPLFMQPGDVIEVEIEGIGVLSNNIAAQGTA